MLRKWTYAIAGLLATVLVAAGATVTIMNLPVATNLTGAEYVALDQWTGLYSGGSQVFATKRASVAQIASFPQNGVPFLVTASTPGFAASRFLSVAASLSLVDGGAGAALTIGTAAISGDCTSVANSFALTCTKTNGAAFAASATTDATNASNIASGTLSASRLPAFTGGDCTSSAGSSTLACAETGGVAFGALATLTPGTGVATALGNAAGAAGGFATYGQLGTGAFTAAYVLPTATNSTLGGVLAQSSYVGATGLGSAANASLGTAGATLCLLNANCTFSGNVTIPNSAIYVNNYGADPTCTTSSQTAYASAAATALAAGKPLAWMEGCYLISEINWSSRSNITPMYANGNVTLRKAANDGNPLWQINDAQDVNKGYVTPVVISPGFTLDCNSNCANALVGYNLAQWVYPTLSAVNCTNNCVQLYGGASVLFSNLKAQGSTGGFGVAADGYTTTGAGGPTQEYPNAHRLDNPLIFGNAKGGVYFDYGRTFLINGGDIEGNGTNGGSPGPTNGAVIVGGHVGAETIASSVFIAPGVVMTGTWIEGNFGSLGAVTTYSGFNQIVNTHFTSNGTSSDVAPQAGTYAVSGTVFEGVRTHILEGTGVGAGNVVKNNRYDGTNSVNVAKTMLANDIPATQYSVFYNAAGTVPQGVLTGALATYALYNGATPGTQTTRTAAQLYADFNFGQGTWTPYGFQYFLRISNTGSSTLTLAGGSGVSLGTGRYTLPASSSCDFSVTLNPSTATIQSTNCF